MPASVLSRTSVELAAVARSIADDPDRWLPIVRYDAQERWYTRLTFTDEYEVWLLSWLPGQRTGVHDHGGSAGVFAVADGSLREIVVENPRDGLLEGLEPTLSTAEYDAGQAREFDSHHVHEIVNAGDRPAVSVHVYAPALSSMHRYRIEDGILRLTSSERAGADW
ncbi:cysteine dioxygenase [Rhodococcus sp. NPDC003382]|uniref:cysteine dioxygenase n=1 Tax=Rhodococcus sp. CX TaxID=2789880 RepID=UPI0018CDCE77|nr:cysteine dioxygenase family protein [Rhodococcus sp. CX]MBH0120803.1 cysteine dioxygenase family protein [Rhodococcus sp. CX]